MLKVVTTTKFKKAQKQNRNIKKLKEIMIQIANEEVLSSQLKNHNLTGNYNNRQECHISPDWLLVYFINSDEVIFERINTHSEIFK